MLIQKHWMYPRHAFCDMRMERRGCNYGSRKTHGWKRCGLEFRGNIQSCGRRGFIKEDKFEAALVFQGFEMFGWDVASISSFFFFVSRR
jgi:hypothetical protein